MNIRGERFLKKDRLPPKDLPFNFHGIEVEYGTVEYGLLICPGVYVAVLNPLSEVIPECVFYYVVMPDSPAISQKARAFGIPLPTAPEVLLYPFGIHVYPPLWRVAEYEALGYRYLHDSSRQYDAAAVEDILQRHREVGMELFPKYFGEVPPPAETPWGAPLASQQIWNGLLWVKTASEGWVFVVGYSVSMDLPKKTEAVAHLLNYDGKSDRIEHCGYRFYTYRESCLPNFALWCRDHVHAHPWEEYFSLQPLKNAVAEFFPKQMRSYNRIWKRRMDRLKQYVESGMLPEKYLQETVLLGKLQRDPSAGTDFYRIPFPDC